MRIFFMVLLVVIALNNLAAFASESSSATEPKVTVTLSNDAPLVGKMTTVKIKVLVPTWFAKPLYFDEVDTVNVISVKGNKSTYPTSERIGSKTWTGVIKEYPVIAMTHGRFELKLPRLKIHYMDENSKAVNTEVTPEPVVFNATLPKIASTLTPIIIAESITLEEDVNAPENLIEGQSIQRKITATIVDSSALFIPPLMTTKNTEQQQSYPVNASVSDTLNDRTSTLTGVRQEQQDIVVKQAGTLNLSAIKINYYQPSTDSIQTAEIEGSEVVVANAPASLQTWLLRLVALAVAGGIVFGFYRLCQYYWQRYQQSEYASFQRLLQQVSVTKGVDKTHYQAFIVWRKRWQNVVEHNAKLAVQNQEIILLYEQALYAGEISPTDFKQQLKDFRLALKQYHQHNAEILQPLNP